MLIHTIRRTPHHWHAATADDELGSLEIYKTRQQLLYDARVQVSFRMSPSTLNSPLTLTSNPDSCKSLRNSAMAKPKERIR